MAGGKTYANKQAYSDAMKLKRGDKGKSFKTFLNKNILGSKTQLKKGKMVRFKDSLFKKGTMVKARGGGMARMKPTKLY